MYYEYTKQYKYKASVEQNPHRVGRDCGDAKVNGPAISLTE